MFRYKPRNPYLHTAPDGRALYPSVRATQNDQRMFEDKYELDTLFFVFYYQQGSFQQYLA